MAERLDREARAVAHIGEVLDGRYRLEGVIGLGGTATVYRARQIRADRLVAVKVIELRSDSRRATTRRFLNEARVIGGLRHPNTVTVHDFGTLPDGRLFMAMELIEGEPLSAAIDSGPLPVGRALRIAIDVCDALEEAHFGGVVHRDLKPANILLECSPNRLEVARVVDFGLARIVEDHDRITRTGVVNGTPAYLSPEQCRSESVDGRADIYALGVVLFEMLTGRRPFDSLTPTGYLYHHVSTPPPDIGEVAPHLPPVLDPLIAGMMAKARDDRPGDVGAVRDVLRRALRRLELDGRGTTLDLQPPVHPEAKPKSRPAIPIPPRRAAWVAGAAIAAAVTFALWL